MREETAPVVIIGSGMGGGTTAYALTKLGIEVLILERGDYLPTEAENWSAQAIFIDKRYRHNEMWIDKNGKEFSPGVHYFVGGNSKLYGAALPRFRAEDFGEIKHLQGTSPAWPFTYDDFEPYYYQAESLYKVHSDAGVDPTEGKRSKPFPHAAMPHERYVLDLKNRFTNLGLHPFPSAMGIDLGDGGKCIRCSTCDGFVCKLNAKSDAQSCALEEAQKTGLVRVLTNAKVKKLVPNSDGSAIDHVLVEGPEGDYIVRGDKYVLAAGAVNSAALMLKSGVGNSSGLVGRNYMTHINSHIATFDPFRKNDITFQKTLSWNDWYLDGGKGYPLGAVQLIGKVTGLMMKSYATKMPRFILDYIADHSVEFVVMTEDLPHPDNRIEVDKDGRIHVILNQVGMKTHLELLKKAKKFLRKSGFKLIFRQPFDISMNAHQCGTVKAGNDPKTSVVDQYCKSHDLDNLYVIDGGFFPSSAALNPALTIAAQALRVVAESGLAKELQKR